MGVGRGPVTPSDLCKAGLVVSTAEMLRCSIIKYLAGCGLSSLRMKSCRSQGSLEGGCQHSGFSSLRLFFVDRSLTFLLLWLVFFLFLPFCFVCLLLFVLF